MTCYELNAPKVIQESFDDEVVAIDFDKGHYFGMRGSAADIWRNLLAGHAPEAIEAALAQQPGGDPSGVVAFVARLLETGLIRATGTTAPPAQPLLFVTKTFDVPVLEQHTDMAELLLLDPIHEVDATGWPKQAGAA
jgi:hypothetical protein